MVISFLSIVIVAKLATSLASCKRATVGVVLTRRRSDCPISFALDVFGDRWTLLIVRDLMFKDKRHYGDFLKSQEHIATNILADRLRRLEETGIVRRNAARRNAGGVTYELTDRGIDLAPVLLEMILWSAKHDANTAAAPEFVAAARDDRNALLRQIAKSIRDPSTRERVYRSPQVPA